MHCACLFPVLPLLLQLIAAAASELLLSFCSSMAAASGLLLGLLLLLGQDVLQLLCSCAAGICQHAYNALTYCWNRKPAAP
jgi:hypothetical protein